MCHFQSRSANWLAKRFLTNFPYNTCWIYLWVVSLYTWRWGVDIFILVLMSVPPSTQCLMWWDFVELFSVKLQRCEGHTFRSKLTSFLVRLVSCIAAWEHSFWHPKYPILWSGFLLRTLNWFAYQHVWHSFAPFILDLIMLIGREVLTIILQLLNGFKSFFLLPNIVHCITYWIYFSNN